MAELAAFTTRPERVVGLHLFSPVPVMKLVEVVVAMDTAPDAVAAAEAFVSQIGKQSIRTKDRAGFVVNMLLAPYLVAGVRMYEEGFASREDIDDGMRLGCGHPIGPLRLCDFIGLDVLQAVCDSLYDEFNVPSTPRHRCSSAWSSPATSAAKAAVASTRTTSSWGRREAGHDPNLTRRRGQELLSPPTKVERIEFAPGSGEWLVASQSLSQICRRFYM